MILVNRKKWGLFFYSMPYIPTFGILISYVQNEQERCYGIWILRHAIILVFYKERKGKRVTLILTNKKEGTP